MITASFFEDEKKRLSGFSLTGHADSVKNGMDPICAAVSGMATLVANTLTEVQRIAAEVKIGGPGHFSLAVPGAQLDLAQDILNGFLLQMRDYEAQYPESIRVITNFGKEEKQC